MKKFQAAPTKQDLSIVEGFPMSTPALFIWESPPLGVFLLFCLVLLFVVVSSCSSIYIYYWIHLSFWIDIFEVAYVLLLHIEHVTWCLTVDWFVLFLDEYGDAPQEIRVCVMSAYSNFIQSTRIKPGTTFCYLFLLTKHLQSLSGWNFVTLEKTEGKRRRGRTNTVNFVLFLFSYN